MTDVLIMSYILLLVILIHQAEKFKENSLKIIIIGITLTPIAGFAMYYYFDRKASEKSNLQTSIPNS